MTQEAISSPARTKILTQEEFQQAGKDAHAAVEEMKAADGITIIDMETNEEALMWAAKVMVACCCQTACHRMCNDRQSAARQRNGLGGRGHAVAAARR